MPDSHRALAGLAILSVVVSVGACVYTGCVGAPLRQPHSPAPLGGLSLQLPPNDAQAHAIVEYWSSTPDPTNAARRLSDVARAAIAADYWFILSCVAALLLTLAWAVRSINSTAAATAARKVSHSVAGAVAAVVVITALCDLAENRLMTFQLDPAQPLVPGLSASWNANLASLVGSRAAGLCRAASMSKFIAFMYAVLAVLTLVGGALRRRPMQKDESDGDPQGKMKFSELLRKENEGIFYDTAGRTPDDPVVVESNDAAEEPWVAFRAADVSGLALSGGGIRSATFNLGLLRGLNRLSLLRPFDYVSTVSGGGYVGSMWSEWLARRKDAAFARNPQLKITFPNWAVPPGELFPPAPEEQPQVGNIESAPERHLREFSRFLSPRWGFFEAEMWSALVALLSGLLPAMVIGLSVIGTAGILWLSMVFPLACSVPLAGSMVIMALTAVTMAAFESSWQSYKGDIARAVPAGEDAKKEEERRNEQEKAERQRLLYFTFALAAVLLVCVLQALMPHVYLRLSDRWFDGVHSALPVYIERWEPAHGQGGFERWWWVAGIQNPHHSWMLSPRLFDYGIVWLVSSLIFIGVRLLFAIWPSVSARETVSTYDRVLMRLLGLGVMWIVVALVWHLAMNIQNAASFVGAALVSAGTFAALRNWIGVAFRRPAESGILDRVKPYVPQLLAYFTVVLASGIVGCLLIRLCGDDWLRWWGAAFLQGLVLVLGLFILPGEFGLHRFYRDRISRAYAGASIVAPGESAAHNRWTEPQTGDSRRLSKLVGRPLQLICCAANDLTGDSVRTLSRGARSAVLSKHGFAIGPYAAPPEDLAVGAAVTASAAAFNSNMGKVSLEVGPAVSFLMTSLNLRLGLWLRHPKADDAPSRRWPGLLLYREMFGRTGASGKIENDEPLPLLLRDVHLSDGGHFENLALYELIRRHCRYIIVSDCGADPDIAFDDLGNALRRVREDFGVDVTLDISPLRPADGWSRQHVAIGTIHYSKTDKGILLYVKPTLTGDEPPDVLQYKARNTSFPHESTSDQFYDEAQWESYRRLGEHAAECIFDFVQPSVSAGDTLTSDWLFAQSVYRWGPTPLGLMDRVLEMTKRFAEAESRLRSEASPDLRLQVFPELDALGGDMGEQPGKEGVVRKEMPSAGTDLLLIVRVTQLMEDAWTACDLDRWWHHPLNLGWINLFARWATAPTFKFWWPVVAPMFSPGFRTFIDDRFPTPPPLRDGSQKYFAGVAQRGRVVELVVDGARTQGLAEVWWRTRSTQPTEWAGKTVYQNLVTLEESPRVDIQVGIAAVTLKERKAGWTSEDFFVPPSLWGTGLGWYFLDNLLRALRTTGVTEVYVVVKAPPTYEQTKVAIDDRHGFIEHYRKMGFRQRLFREFRRLDEDERKAFRRSQGNFDDVFARTLGYRGEAEDGAPAGEQDALLVLDLDQWARTRPEISTR